MSSPIHYPSDGVSSEADRGSHLSLTPTSQLSHAASARRRRPHGRGDIVNRRAPIVEAPVAVSEQKLSSDAVSTDILDRAAIWGTTVNVESSIKQFTKFFRTFSDGHSDGPKYPALLDEIASSQGWNLNLDCRNLHAFDPQMYQRLVEYPQEMIPIFDMVINTQFRENYPEIEQEQDARIKVKTMNLLSTKTLRGVDPDDIDKIVAFDAMVVRVSSIIPDLRLAFFRCVRCQMEVTREIDRGRIQEPSSCPNNNCMGKGSMDLIHNRCEFADKQLVRVQETPDAIPEGETPQTIDVFAYDDLVDVAKPGDRLTVTGIFRAVPVRVIPRSRVVRSVYKGFIDAIHFQKSSNRRLNVEDSAADAKSEYFTSFDESDEVEHDKKVREEKFRELAKDPNIYQRLVSSIAPQIWELEDIKKGILCQLFGGTRKEFQHSGSGRFRGEVNILLCGDPGTAKSQLLQYVHKIAPRGIYTSGKGSSAVGLTAYITKDIETGELVLESGALVLSDRGICCIDEFDKMSDSARSILHEVMEQQTISIAKAGIICSLNARTSILAAANPRDSRYDVNLSVVENVTLPPTLLSRFDLIYLVLDKPNERLDSRLAQHLVSLYYQERDPVHEDIIDIETLTQYISYARREIQPTIGDEAVEALIEGYSNLRQSGRNYNKKVITATPRQLESLIRLSEALARMKFSPVVSKDDVAEALRLMRVATQTAATDPKTGRINMDLITTGQSGFARTELENQGTALTAIIDDLPSAKNYFVVLMKNFNDKSQKKLAKHEFKELLLSLERQETIRIGTWVRGNPMVTRLDG